MPRLSLRWLLIGALLLTSLAAISLTPRGQALAFGPDPVTAAWERARAAGSYAFASDIVQQTVPSATVGNVGRSSRTEQLRMEGQTNLHKRQMALQLWSDNGSVALPDSGVAVRVENSKTFTRQGTGPWQEDQNFTDGLAPDGDFMNWLVAVKAVTAHEAEVRAGLRFTRYSFQLDGPLYAAHVRNQMESALRQAGELPPGGHLELPAYYRDMTGNGELWVREDGLPLRQLLNLHFPEKDAQRVQLQLKTDFFDFGKATAVSSDQSAANSGWLRTDYRSLITDYSTLLATLLPMLALAVIVFHYRRKRLIYNALAISVIVSMIVGPVLSNSKLVSFIDTQRAKAAAAEEQRQESDMQRTLRSIDAELAFDPHQNPLESSEPAVELGDWNVANMLESATASPQSLALQAPTLQSTTDPGTDTDGDGLTDFVEARVGTLPDQADSDSDLVPDNLEVRGFSYNNQQWYSDPTSADTNRDQMADTLEWGVDANGAPLATPSDTDNDKIPDLFDDDNDNDGVPDRKDLAPTVSNQTAYNTTTPFTLQMRNVEAGKPLFVELQVRPQNDKHLWFAHNVLDWPTDNAGQVRDIDGKTYADYVASQGRTPTANEANGDLRLVPMLELRAPVNDLTVPPQSDLTAYNITGDVSADGTQRILYLPLVVETDEKTGQRVAFKGQMRYQSGPTGGFNNHAYRLAWVVQQLSDVPCDLEATPATPNCAADGYVHNQPQVIHVYYDDWRLTGLNAREDHGAEMAIIYEDPAVDPNLKNENNLWALSFALDQTFIGARDEGGNGRDITVAEIARRFERTTNGAVSPTQRWGLDNILRVQHKSYPYLDQAIATTAMTETQRILNDVFRAPWTSDKAIKPLLMFAQESRSRGLGLDAVAAGGGYATFSGNGLTLDMRPAGQPPVALNVQALLKWTPYCAPNAASPLWAACATESYWDELANRVGPNPLLPGDPNDPDVAAGRMGTAQFYNLAMSQGVMRVVESGGVVVSSRYSLESDGTIEGIVRGALALVQTAVVEFATIKILSKELYNTTMARYIGIELRELKEGMTAKFQGAAKALKKLTGLKKFAAGVGLAAAGAAILAALGTLIALPIAYGSDGAKITIRVVQIAMLVILLLLPAIGTVIELADNLKKIDSRLGVKQTLLYRSELTGFSTKAGMIGVYLTGAIAFGFFIYGMVSNRVSAFSPQFNAALAETIATVVYAVLIVALTSTLVGLIIYAVIAILDLILTAICEAGVRDLRKVPGLGGACFTLGNAAIKVIAKLLYSFDVMVDTDRKDMVVTGALDIALVDPTKGFIPGNNLTLALPVTTTIVHKDPALENLLHLLPYLWFFSKDNLRSTTFKYSLTTPISQTIKVNRDEMNNSWQNLVQDHKWGAVPMYRAQAVSPHGPATAIIDSPGLNKSVQAYLNMGYALPAYECWAIPNILPPWIPPYIPVCYPRSMGGTDHTKIDMLRFDYFPATVDGFMELAEEGDGSLGLKWDPAFAGLADADGDGLLVSARGGLDPDDSAPDADNDGLTDAYELERRQNGTAYSPVQRDTDGDGLTDRQEMELETNPAVADSDNDGLNDGEEVWHQRYDPNTGQPTTVWEGGWSVTINGATPFTVRVSSDPHDEDIDDDGISDQAERQLALYTCTTAEVTAGRCVGTPPRLMDNEGRTYHPLVANTPVLAVYTASSDVDGYVAPGQSFRYTSTVVANYGVTGGVLEVVRPPALGGNSLLYGLPFNVNATSAQTITHPSALTVAANAATGPQGLLSTARARLPGSGGSGWVFDPITLNQLGGFTTPARWADVAPSRSDRQDSFRIAALTSDSTAQRGLGDVWSYALPAGSGAAIEDDNNNVNFLRGALPPSVACNDAGACMVVWDQYDNCNTLTINSLKVVTAGGDHGTSGIEPFLNLGPTGSDTRLWDWTRGGGTADMRTNDQRGPNAFGFPVQVPFCGSMTLHAWESDSATEIDAVGSHTFTRDQVFFNSLFRFEGSGHVLELNISLPRKNTYTLGGALIQPDGSRQPVAFPDRLIGPIANNFRPVVVSNGTNFVVLSEEALDQFFGFTDTHLVLRLYNADGSFAYQRNKQLTLNNRTAPLDRPSIAYDLIWKGDGYRAAWRTIGDSTITFQDFGVDIVEGASTVVATDAENDPNLPPDISLAYNPLTGRQLLLYKNEGVSGMIGRLYQGVNPLGSPLNLSASTPAERPSVAWNPITRGWLASWINSGGQVVLAPLNNDGSPLVGQQAALDNLKSNALACPVQRSAPLVDLRFEELPGATTFADSSGYGNNLTCSGASCPSAGTAGAPNAPLSDYGLQFDGVDDQLSQPSKVQDDFTIAFWMKTTASSGRLVDAGSTLANGFGISLFQGKIFFERTGFTFGTPAAYNNGQWHFVVATRTATGEAAIYVDGVAAATGSLGTGSLNSQAELTIGRGGNGNTFYTGALDHLRIYPVALAGSTVKELYDNTLQSYCVAVGTKEQNNVEWAKLILRQPDTRGGRINASSGLTVTVDADQPTAAVESVQNNQYLKGSSGAPVTHIIGGTSSDATSGVDRVAVRVNNGAFQPATGAENWQYALAVTEGPYKLEAQATDAVGLVGPVSPAVTVIADGQPPQVASNPLAATPVSAYQFINGRWSVNLAGTVSDPAIGNLAGSGVAQVEVRLDAQQANGLASTWQPVVVNGTAWNVEYALTDGIADPTGSYTMTLRAVDTVGNQREVVAGSLRLDAAAPTAALSPQDASRLSITQTLTLSGAITETAPGSAPVAGIDKLDVDFAPLAGVALLAHSDLYLPFDERNGARYFYDRSGRGNHGGCFNCPVNETGGRGDGALQAASGLRVTVSSGSSLDFGRTASFSLHAWVKPTGFGNLLTTGDAATVGSYGMQINGQGGPRFGWTEQPNQSSLLDGQPDLRDGQWHHFVVVVDRGTQRATLYVDGVSRANANITNASFAALGSLSIGGVPGLFDEFAIFSRALSADEVQTLYHTPSRQWRPATVTPHGAGVRAGTWTLPLPTGLEGIYQMNLRATDMLGNRLMTANTWRGIVDTVNPRVTLVGQATGATHLDAAGVRRYEIQYTCRAEDLQLKEASFDCAGNAQRPPLRTFNNDAVLNRLFPDLTILTTLVNTYTVWATSQTPAGTLTACDVYNHCTTANATLQAASNAQAVSAAAATGAPQAVIVHPTDGAVVNRAGTVPVTVAAEATAGLKEVTIRLNGQLVATLPFAQTPPTTNLLRTLPITPTTDGVHTLVAQATDWAGATQTQLFPQFFTRDSQPPVVTIASDPLTVDDSYGPGSDILRLRGTATDNVGLNAVKVQVASPLWSLPFADATFEDGQWGIALPIPDPENQTFTVTVRAIDLAGLVGTTTRREQVQITQGTPPETTITANPGTTSAASTATFTFTGTNGDREVAEFTCQIDGGDFEPCASPWTIVDLGQGEHTFRVRAVDALGFVDLTPASHSWTVTAGAAGVNLTEKPANPTASHTARFVFTAAGAPGYECALEGGRYAACTSPQLYPGLADGKHTFLVRVTGDGKVHAPTRYSWQVIDAAPLAQNQTVTTTTTSPITITLAATDLDTVQYRLVSRPTRGVLLGTAPKLVYQADSGFVGIDQFTFVANAGLVDSTLATVTIRVAPSPGAGVAIATCGGYLVYQLTTGGYIALGWSGAIQVGTSAANTLVGTAGRDLMLGLAGNDKLDGKEGDDLLCGGDGVDQLLGAAGKDSLDGGTGNDVLNSGTGDHDIMLAGDGNDTLLDGDGVSEARGGAGTDGFTIALRNGWPYPQGQNSFAGLTAGYGNDTVGLANLGTTALKIDISGDERDTGPNPQEGTTDALTRSGRFTADSIILKFERQTVSAASAEGEPLNFDGFLVDPTTLTDESGAEFLTEPVGEGSDMRQLFLPLVGADAPSNSAAAPVEPTPTENTAPTATPVVPPTMPLTATVVVTATETITVTPEATSAITPTGTITDTTTSTLEPTITPPSAEAAQGIEQIYLPVVTQ